MSPEDRPSRDWTRVRTCPVSGLELCVDGSFRIGERRFSPRGGLSGYRLGDASLDKEPGEGCPLVLESPLGRLFLLYHDGLWYQSHAAPTPERGAELPPRSPAGAGLEELPLELIAPAEGFPAAAVPAFPTPQTNRPVEPATYLPYTEPGSLEPESAAHEPPRRTQRPGGRRLPAVLAPLLLVLVAGVVTALTLMPGLSDTVPADQVAAQCRFDENTWLETGAYHTLVSHAFLYSNALELAYVAGGILLFGWVVQRNVGFVRTLLLFCFCAAFSVGFWQFAKTPLGQDLIVRYAGKLFEYLRDKISVEAGVAGWLAYAAAWDHMLALQGPVWGGLGALAGLMTFAVCRRRFRGGQVGVKWVVLLMALGYMALGGFVWENALGKGLGSIPFILCLGGAFGGMFFVIPDKILHQCLDVAKDKLKDAVVERLGNGEGRQAA